MSAKIRKSDRNNEHRGSDVAVDQILPVGFGWFAHGGIEPVARSSDEDAVEPIKDFGIALVPLMRSPDEPERVPAA